jgi:hypothetical protein
MKSKILVAAVFVLFAVSISSANAQVAGVEWTNSTDINPAGAWDMGYEFDVTDSVTVFALGAFDEDGDGLNSSHLVGLFTEGGVLLASTTVNDSDSLIGHFRYSDLDTPEVLSPGRYVVVAMNFGPETDHWGSTEGDDNDLVIADGIDNILRVFRDTSGSLSLDLISEGGCCSTSGYFGGNILVSPGDSVVEDSVPVPTLNNYMMMLMTLMLAWVAYRRLGGLRVKSDF